MSTYVAWLEMFHGPLSYNNLSDQFLGFPSLLFIADLLMNVLVIGRFMYSLFAVEVIVKSLPGGVVVLHIGVGHSPTPICKTTPQGGI